MISTLQGASAFLGLPLAVWQALNLVLFFVVLVVLLRKPTRGFFASRRAAVEKALARAEEDRRRAEGLAAELTQRLREIEGEIDRLRTRSTVETETEKARLLREAEEDASRLMARASTEIESRVRAARAELTGYAGDLAVEIARELLHKGLTPEDRERLLREGVAELEKAGRSSR